MAGIAKIGWCKYRILEGGSALEEGQIPHEISNTIGIQLSFEYAWSENRCDITNLKWQPVKITEDHGIDYTQAIEENGKFDQKKAVLSIKNSDNNNVAGNITQNGVSPINLNSFTLNETRFEAHILTASIQKYFTINLNYSHKDNKIEYYVEVKCKIYKPNPYDKNVVFTEEGVKELLTNIKNYPIIGVSHLASRSDTAILAERDLYLNGAFGAEFKYGNPERISHKAIHLSSTSIAAIVEEKKNNQNVENLLYDCLYTYHSENDENNKFIPINMNTYFGGYLDGTATAPFPELIEDFSRNLNADGTKWLRDVSNGESDGYKPIYAEVYGKKYIKTADDIQFPAETNLNFGLNNNNPDGINYGYLEIEHNMQSKQIPIKGFENSTGSNLMVSAPIIPNLPSMYSLGSNEKHWRAIYGDSFVGGTATFTSVKIGDVTIGGDGNSSDTSKFLRGDGTWSNTLESPSGQVPIFLHNNSVSKGTAPNSTKYLGSLYFGGNNGETSGNTLAFSHLAVIQSTVDTSNTQLGLYAYSNNSSTADYAAAIKVVYSDSNSDNKTSFDTFKRQVSTSDDTAFMATKVFNAVFNDYAEYRSTINLTPGHVIIDQDDGSLVCSTARLQSGAQVISDTFGHSMGETDTAKTPIAVAGRVLVYPYQPRENYHAGMAVCSAPDGTVDIMTREEIRDYPDCIVGIVSEIPEYETWGSDNVKVNGRIWIRVK